MNLGTLGTLFLLTLYLQQVHGLSPLGAGVAVLPLFLPLSLLAPLAGRLTARVGPKIPMVAGLAVAAGGPALLARLRVGSEYATLLPALLLWGIGLAALTPAVVAAAIGAVQSARAGLASAMNNTARQAGGAIGIAALGALAGWPANGHAFPGRPARGGPDRRRPLPRCRDGHADGGVAWPSPPRPDNPPHNAPVEKDGRVVCAWDAQPSTESRGWDLWRTVRHCRRPDAAADACHPHPMTTCTHLDQIRIDPPETVEGCEDCLRIGGRWVHLRTCLSCGHVGCCDSSPNRHASAHAGESGHPIVRSAEPGETWCWCYVDEVAFELAA